MSLSTDDLKAILEHQRELFEKSQLQLITTLTKRLEVSATAASSNDDSAAHFDTISAAITEFHYEPSLGHTFDVWFKRWEDTFQNDFSSKDSKWKARLLVRKLGTAEHKRFTNFILPQQPKDLNFEQTVSQLSEIFSEQLSLFNIRYNCLKLTKRESDDYVTFAGLVNSECEKFQLQSLTEDQFKCLIFVAGLQSSQDADIRTRLLSRLEQDKDITVKTLTAECQRLVNLKHDTNMIQQTVQPFPTSAVQAVIKNTDASTKRPPSACWSCGEWHFKRFCPFIKHQCQRCNRRGHKEGFCDTQGTNTSNRRRNQRCDNLANIKSNSVFAAFKVDFESRRQYITLTINDIPVRLQLDTASDITLITRSTWESIGKPLVCSTNHQAHSASGNTLQLTGEVTCDVTFRNVHFEGTCYLTNLPNLNLLGLDWMFKLNILTVPLTSVCNTLQLTPNEDISKHFSNHILSKFPSLFQSDLGCCTKVKAALKLLPNAKPVFRPKRPVPYAALPTVEKELERISKPGVIKPVNY